MAFYRVWVGWRERWNLTVRLLRSFIIRGMDGLINLIIATICYSMMWSLWVGVVGWSVYNNPHSARNGRQKIIKKQLQGANSDADRQEKRNLKATIWVTLWKETKWTAIKHWSTQRKVGELVGLPMPLSRWISVWEKWLSLSRFSRPMRQLSSWFGSSGIEGINV